MTENQEFATQEPPSDEPQKKSMKGWLIGGCAAIGLLVIGAIVLFIVFDPFGVVALLFGGGDIAKIVPDDVVMYAEVDLLSLQSEDLAEIIMAFQDASGNVEEVEPETYEEGMEDEFGVTMDDINPWIGQHIGFALEELQIDQMEGYEPVPMVLIAEVRDKDEADAFIAKVIEYREDEFGDDFDTFEFDGVDFFESEDEFTPVVLGRYRNYMFFSPEKGFLEDVLEMVQKGRRAKGKLADLELYKRTLEELPEDSMFTLYLDYEEFLDVFTDYMEDEMGPLPYNLPQVFTSFGMSISVVDAGLQMDMVTMYEDPEDVPWADMDIDLENYQAQTAGMVPEETFLFISNHILPGQDKIIEDILGEDYQESMDLLSEEFNINMDEIYASLDGELAIALFRQEEGFLGEVVEVPMGLSILVGINDDNEWDNLFDLLTEEAEYDPLMEVEDVDLDGYDLLSVSMSDGFDTYSVLVYGTGDDYAILSTEVENAEILLGDGDTLADAEKYTQIWEAFPDDTWPIMYIDVAGLVEWVEDISDFSSMYGFDNSYEYENEVDSAAALEPLRAIAVGSSLYNSPDSRTTKVIFFIDR